MERSHRFLMEEINSRIDSLNTISQYFQRHSFQFVNHCDVKYEPAIEGQVSSSPSDMMAFRLGLDTNAMQQTFCLGEQA